MNVELLPVFIDIAVGLGTLMGGVFALWLAFRKHITAWWAPYKAGIEGMAALPEMHLRLDTIHSEMQILVSSQRVMMDANETVGTFEAEPDGKNAIVNATYARWLGCDKSDLLRWGFINFIHPEDRDVVRDELELAKKEIRSYRIQHRLMDTSGNVFWVEKCGSPLPEIGETIKWMGTVRKIDAPLKEKRSSIR